MGKVLCLITVTYIKNQLNSPDAFLLQESKMSIQAAQDAFKAHEQKDLLLVKNEKGLPQLDSF